MCVCVCVCVWGGGLGGGAGLEPGLGRAGVEHGLLRGEGLGAHEQQRRLRVQPLERLRHVRPVHLRRRARWAQGAGGGGGGGRGRTLLTKCTLRTEL